MTKKIEHTNPIIKFSEVEELIKLLGTDIEITLVGGQALGFWVTYYYEQFPELFNEKSNELVLTTTDIDFVASSGVAKKCAEIWGGEIIIPEKWDTTVNTAIVSLNLVGVGKVEIDFLSNYERLNHVSKCYFQEVSLSDTKPIYVLSAFTVFLSKLANCINLRRSDFAGLGSLKASLLVVKCHLMEKIKDKELKFVYLHIEQILYLAANVRHGRVVYNEHNIDILDAIPDDLTELESRFVEFNISPKITKIHAGRPSKP